MALYLFVQGKSWTVERRHEIVGGDARPEKAEASGLFLFFTAADGEIRRSEIAADFPEEPAARLLESVWRFAEVMRVADLRCPNCGGGRVLRTWFKLQHRCAKCGLRLDRGEADDYFLGGMFFNIVLAEIIFALALLVVVIVMWPNVPWAGVEYSLIVAMIAAPIVLYPVSRLMWLALDLLLRPPDEAEMAWHASEEE
jgi:uncharacterized protein (DUF983 family)